MGRKGIDAVPAAVTKRAIEKREKEAGITYDEETKALDSAIEQALKGYDEFARKERQDLKKKEGRARSFYWAWLICKKIHSENAILRRQLRVLTAMLIEQLKFWQEANKKLALEMADSKALSRDDLKKLSELSLAVNETVIRISDAVTRVRKEIRQTEFSSRFYVHINTLQQLMLGIVGIVYQSVGDPRITDKILRQIQVLSRQLSMSTETPIEGEFEVIDQSEEDAKGEGRPEGEAEEPSRGN